MTHPLFHNNSSAKRFGGKPEDYIAIHDWFDETKEFDDSRKLGVIMFTLATICFQNPEALKRLEKRVADINRQVHILDARRTVDKGKRRKIT